MTSGMREAVSAISAIFPTAIISGRARKKVQNFVDLPGLTYAGSHGMDIQVTSAVGALSQSFEYSFTDSCANAVRELRVLSARILPYPPQLILELPS